MKNKLLYRKRLSQFAYSLCLMLLCSTASWGQDQVIGTFPFMQGGFENQTVGSITSTTINGTTWSRGTSASSSIVGTSGARTGGKYAVAAFATGTLRALQTPNGVVTIAAVPYTVQFWVKNATVGTFQVGLNTSNVSTAGVPTTSPDKDLCK